MAQGRKGKLNYRCPRCLMREIDMDMLYDADKDEYYCLRCSFVGDESRGPSSQRPVPGQVPRPRGGESRTSDIPRDSSLEAACR